VVVLPLVCLIEPNITMVGTTPSKNWKTTWSRLRLTNGNRTRKCKQTHGIWDLLGPFASAALGGQLRFSCDQPVALMVVTVAV
jgi:hypothetical protein